MGQSYTNLLYHIAFATKDRQPLIVGERRERLYEYLGGIIRNLGGISLGINGMPDHMHVLAKLRPDRALSDMLRDVKANSSGWMHEVFPEASNFAWQRGYGAFTVSASQVEKVQRYIAEQEIHHAKRDFRDEFVELLVKNRIEFDERYLELGTQSPAVRALG
ncbi:MAG TPA: IS200/IS605 family transposase [Pyrinomonadaceae bacterium]|nr:IS200/IS605 family transposase [Pyrinomonadaceae bacterium]